MSVALIDETVAVESPSQFILCWVEQGGYSDMCVDKIAEWLTTDRSSIRDAAWVPTCTGCKDRFISLNATVQVKRLP